MNQNSTEESKKTKMTKDIVPEDFTLSLAVVDSLPVLFFGGSMVLIGLIFNSFLFLAGALLCFWAGAAKVLWKIIVVIKKKNIWWLFMQMRTVMPAGFLLMILSVIINIKKINMGILLSNITSLPSAVFFLLWIIGMVLMGIFGAKLDASDLRSNWIEQLTNTAAQASFFIGILLLY